MATAAIASPIASTSLGARSFRIDFAFGSSLRSSNTFSRALLVRCLAAMRAVIWWPLAPHADKGSDEKHQRARPKLQKTETVREFITNSEIRRSRVAI